MTSREDALRLGSAVALRLLTSEAGESLRFELAAAQYVLASQALVDPIAAALAAQVALGQLVNVLGQLRGPLTPEEVDVYTVNAEAALLDIRLEEGENA